MRYLLHTKTLCLEYGEYIREEMVTEELFWQQKHRGEILVHGNGEKALIEYESLPHKYKAKIIAKYGDVYQYAARQPLLKLVKKDLQARKFYANYELPTGSLLPLANQGHYSRQADWLNLITEIQADKKAFKEMLNVCVKSIWKSIIELSVTDTIAHKLPTSEKRLREKHIKYVSEGYAGLVEAWRFTNQHARLVTPKIENLLMALYMKRHGRATLIQVVRDYNAFMRGESAPVDLITGEVFQQDDFLVKGSLYELSAATVKYYLNRKDNREAIDLMKLSGGDFTQKHGPYNRRTAPRFAFSTVTMDDYLPPFKTMDGKREVWMYVIMDVASEAIVGVAFGVSKTFDLVLEAQADMARNCMENGWGLPLELEMERSLNYEHRGTKDKPDIFTPGHIYPNIRFVRGGNSQGKKVERFLQNFKYQELADEAGFLGRPHGRNENYKLNTDKKEGRYMVTELIKRLKEHVRAYNETASPNPSLLNPPKEDLKGGEIMSRWEWMCRNMNPDCVKYKPQTLMPYVGLHTETSIYRRLVSVGGRQYEVPLELENNAKDSAGRVYVDAYSFASASLSDRRDKSDRVWLYQNGKFLCEGIPADRYNYSTAERTAEDWKVMQRQTAKQKEFMERTKERLAGIPAIGTVNTDKAVEFVNVPYDKLEQEEEEEALTRPLPKGEETHAHSFDQGECVGNPWDNIEEYAQNSL